MDELSAIVVAAGSSSRFLKSAGERFSNLPSKTMIEWNGKPLLHHTLEALSVLPLREVIIVTRDEDRAFVSEKISSFRPKFPILWAPGGARRQDSVRNGLANVNTDCKRVFVHDGARPFLDAQFLKQLYSRSLEAPALIPVLPMVETLKEVDESGAVVRTHPRARFVRVQTPQFFEYALLRRAHDRYADSAEEFTDDAAMVEAIGTKVQTMEGHPANVKVTTLEDIKGLEIHD